MADFENGLAPLPINLDGKAVSGVSYNAIESTPLSEPVVNSISYQTHEADVLTDYAVTGINFSAERIGKNQLYFLL